MEALRAIDKLMASGGLAALQAAAQTRTALQDRVDTALPASLRGRVAVTRLTGNVLHLAAATPALATRLRLSEPALCAVLRADGGPFAALEHVHCHVAPVPAPAPRPTTPGGPVRNAAGATALLETAQSLQDDGLRAACERLAAHLAGAGEA